MTEANAPAYVKHREYLLVTVPEDAKDFAIHSLDDYDKLVFSSTIQDRLNCGGDMLIIPPGTWQLMGRASELTEEQWKPIFKRTRTQEIDIDLNKIGESIITYWYNSRGYEKAKDAGMVLLRSHNLKPDTTIVLKLNEYI